MVRVANTGISGIIDAYGRVIAKTGLNKDAVVDSGLPVALEQATWFGRYKNVTFLICAILLFAASRISLLLPDE